MADQALYDHHIKKMIKPKENNFLVPKGHFHFSKIDNFRPPLCLEPEKPDHKTHSEMLTYLFFSESELCGGTFSFFEIFYFQVGSFSTKLGG